MNQSFDIYLPPDFFNSIHPLLPISARYGMDRSRPIADLRTAIHRANPIEFPDNRPQREILDLCSSLRNERVAIEFTRSGPSEFPCGFCCGQDPYAGLDLNTGDAIELARDLASVSCSVTDAVADHSVGLTEQGSAGHSTDDPSLSVNQPRTRSAACSIINPPPKPSNVITTEIR